MFSMLWRIKDLFGWLRTFDTQEFVSEMETEYMKAKKSGDYGPAICSYYSHMGEMIHTFYGDYWHFSPSSSPDRVDKLHTKFANELRLDESESKKGLELGCGFGRTVAWMNKNTKASVDGLTLSTEEVDFARKNKTWVIKGDYHDMHMIEDESYDFVYAIYCLKYSNDLNKVFSEIKRILKPGGKFLSYEILTTSHFDENNIDHTIIRNNICNSTNMPPLHSIDNFTNTAIEHNFKFKIQEITGDVEWYYPFFLSTGLYYILKSSFIYVCIVNLEYWGFIPKGSSVFYNRHVVHPSVDFVEGGQQEIITGCTMMTFTKE